MKRKICLSIVGVLGLFIFMTPAWAQYDIAGWWAARAEIDEGDFVTGVWETNHARGKLSFYLYIFQETSTSGMGYFVLWHTETGGVPDSYMMEPYNLFIKNNIFVLYIPTFFDSTTGAPAGATIIMKPYGGPGVINAMRGYYTLYDMETEGSPDLFVRMGSLFFTRVLVNKVPEDVKKLVPFP